MKQKIFIKTFGCQMNEYDSNRIYDSVKKIGYEKTENYEEANCYLLNTCHIRDKAKEKVYHEIGRVKKIFRSKKKPLVIIAGCVAQAENQEMLKRIRRRHHTHSPADGCRQSASVAQEMGEGHGDARE